MSAASATSTRSLTQIGAPARGVLELADEREQRTAVESFSRTWIAIEPGGQPRPRAIAATRSAMSRP